MKKLKIISAAIVVLAILSTFILFKDKEAPNQLLLVTNAWRSVPDSFINQKGEKILLLTTNFDSLVNIKEDSLQHLELIRARTLEVLNNIPQYKACMFMFKYRDSLIYTSSQVLSYRNKNQFSDENRTTIFFNSIEIFPDIVFYPKLKCIGLDLRMDSLRVFTEDSLIHLTKEVMPVLKHNIIANSSIYPTCNLLYLYGRSKQYGGTEKNFHSIVSFDSY